MPSFTDRNGLTWNVALTSDVVSDLRRALGLPKPTSTNFFKRMMNPETMVNALFVACRKQAADRGISDEQFGMALATPDAYEGAGDALIEATKELLTPKRRAKAQTSMDNFRGNHNG